MSSFWHFSKQLVRARGLLLLTLVFAVLSAAGLGVGLLGLAPILKVILGEDGGSLRTIAEGFNAGDPLIQVPEGLVDRLPTDPLEGVVLVLVGVGILTVFGALANFGHQFCSQTMAIVAIARIRLDAFRHAIEMPLATVFGFGPSELVSRINKDAQALQNGFNTLLGKAVAQVTKGLASFLVAVIVDWRLTIIAVVLGPIIAITLRKFGKRIRRGARGSLDAQANLLQLSSESIQGLRAIKTASAEREALGRFARINRTVLGQDLRIRTARAISSPLVETMAVLSVLLLAGVASGQIIDGSMDIDRFILALASLGVAGASLRPLANLVNDIQASAAPADRLMEVLGEPRERLPGVRRARLPRHARSIEFEALSVRYPGAAQPAVDEVSLEVPHGTTVAFVGANGCGKTTLLSVLPGLLRPNRGRVLIDGVDLETVDLRSLRRQIGVVTQEPFIIQGTIADNIRLGLRGVGPEAVRDAARLAHADAFIDELPGGYDAPVGEFGANLSGGQRQRLAIARAMLRDPAILVLDEATSAIDAESQDLINESVRRFAAGRTVLAIAHRMATIMAADRIVVMDAGRIVDQGTHAELVERCDAYQRLARPVATG